MKTVFIVVLATVLAACGGTPATNQIVVSGQDINWVAKTPGNFSAVAKDASGNTLTGKTFTWASSSPNVASVDAATGVVTAKHVGTSKISATSDGVKGEYVLSVYGVEVIVGTAKYSDAAANTYLNMHVRIALPGNVATPAGTMTIKGPNGWNGNATQQFNYGATAQNGVSPSPNSIAVSGAYRFTTKVGDTSYTNDVLLDTSKVLPFAAPINVSNATTSSISASWASVPGALRYSMAVREVVNGVAGAVIKAVDVDTNSGTVGGLNLSPNLSRNYVVVVNAFTLVGDKELPATSDYSYTASTGVLSF